MRFKVLLVLHNTKDTLNTWHLLPSEQIDIKQVYFCTIIAAHKAVYNLDVQVITNVILKRFLIKLLNCCSFSRNIQYQLNILILYYIT